MLNWREEPAWSHFQDRQAQGRVMLRAACDRYSPAAIFLFFSGGYDSLAATHLAYPTVLNHTVGMFPGLDSQPVIKVVHLNTGIGIEETRQYVRQMALWQGWPLVEYTTPIRYEDIVKKHGFPGPDAHRYMYIQLKERAIAALMRDHTLRRSCWRDLLVTMLRQSYAMPIQYQQMLYAALLQAYPLFRAESRRKVLLVTGVRRQESARRMGHVQAEHIEGRRVWLAPLLNWTKDDVLTYTEFADLPPNPVVETLHLSGECLCGAFAHPGELEEICFWYPETGKRIKELEAIVRGEGFPWGWEEAPPAWWNEMRRGQDVLPGFSPLCSSCQARTARSSDEFDA